MTKAEQRVIRAAVQWVMHEDDGLAESLWKLARNNTRLANAVAALLAERKRRKKP